MGPLPEKAFCFVDPGERKEWSRPQHPQCVFWQDKVEFRGQWSRMLRTYIEVGPVVNAR